MNAGEVLGDLVNRETIPNAAKRVPLGNRRHTRALQQPSCRFMVHHRAGRIDWATGACLRFLTAGTSLVRTDDDPAGLAVAARRKPALMGSAPDVVVGARYAVCCLAAAA